MRLPTYGGLPLEPTTRTARWFASLALVLVTAGCSPDKGPAETALHAPFTCCGSGAQGAVVEIYVAHKTESVVDTGADTSTTQEAPPKDATTASGATSTCTSMTQRRLGLSPV